MTSTEWVAVTVLALIGLAWIVVALIGPGYPVRRLTHLEEGVREILARLDEGCQKMEGLRQRIEYLERRIGGETRPAVSRQGPTLADKADDTSHLREEWD